MLKIEKWVKEMKIVTTETQDVVVKKIEMWFFEIPRGTNSMMFGKEREKHWGYGLLPQPVWSVSCCCLWWATVAIFCIQNCPKFRIPREIPLGTSRFKHHPPPTSPTTKLP